MVLRLDGTPEEVMIYRAADSGPGFPEPGYLENILEVALLRDFPEPYLAELRRLLALH